MTIAQARRALADAFRNAGLDSPELDARLLVGHALRLDHTALAASPDRVLSAADERAIDAFKQRRLAREPIAHILGTQEFWGLMLRVTPATLVPRPETETIVETALAAIDDSGPRTRTLRIADLGTGTGALLLALLSELPNAFGVGTDMSADALAVARGNAEQLGLASRARFVRCDFGAALASGFDLVVSNPPYIRSGDIAGLPPETFVKLSREFAELDPVAQKVKAYRGARLRLRPRGVQSALYSERPDRDAFARSSARSAHCARRRRWFDSRHSHLRRRCETALGAGRQSGDRVGDRSGARGGRFG